MESTVMTSGHATSASVALDIGEDRGALVLHVPDRLRDHEIEISRADGAGRRVHTGVHERNAGSGPTLTAIFGSLPAARYVVWKDEATPAAEVTVAAGSVAEIALR